jgi:hypothetical protein
MRRLLTSAVLCIIFTWCPASFAQTGSERITAAPEMQKLLNAMTGSWSMSLNYAPSETRSSGGTGTGHVVFRSGPGGLSLIEDEYSKDSTGEQFGLSVTWWDEAAKGFHALWCDNHLPTGCILMSKLAHWEGEQFVLGDEFERDGRKYEFREVALDLTDKSYRQQLSQGLLGGELKQIISIQANREPQAAQPKAVLRETKLHMPGPDVQNRMLGVWSIKATYAPNTQMPNGGMGEGTEIWRPGPGGLSVIEEKREKNAEGETDGFSVGWWDEKLGGQRFVWCANDVPQGCVMPNDVAKWEGERLVFQEDTEEHGRKIRHAEIFSDITPDSFTQVLLQGEPGEALTNTVTILAKRKPELSVVPEDELQTSGANSKPEMQKLADVLAGRWSGTLTTEPGSREVGRADEIWHVTPGGLTLTEENHLRTSKGDSYDFAAIWWNSKAKEYEGIWCAEINDEGCNGFQASLESNQVIMRGEWEQSGKRRAWREVFSRPNESESIQTLDLGETGGEMKRVSAIHASRTQESTADPGGASGVEQELRNAMAERHRAMLAGDTDIVERLTADEYVQTDISGYVQDKSAWLNEYFRPLAALIKAGKFRWGTYEEKDVQTRTLGDTAIVTGSMTLKGTGAKPSGRTWVESPETTFAGTLRFTRVWVKRDGSWKLAALQNALIPTSTGK